MLLEKKTSPVHSTRPPQRPAASAPSSLHPTAPRLSVSGPFLILLAGLIATGAVFLKNNLGAAWKSQADLFKTVVLVEGSEIDIDEIGGLIRRVPFVKSTRLVTSEEGFLRLMENEIFSEDLNGLDPALVPVSWEIEWDFADGFTQATLQDFQEDLNSFPAVLATGIDWRQFSVISALREGWMNVRLFSSILLFFSGALGLFLLGRNLFFRSSIRPTPPRVFKVLLIDAAAWAAGFGAIYWILGPVNLHLLWGGLLLGLFHCTFLFTQPLPGAKENE